MPYLPYSAETLNNDLLSFSAFLSEKQFFYTNFLSMFYYTGLRFCEVQEFTRWSAPNENQLTVITAKGSYPRTFDNILLPAFFVSCVQDHTNPFKGINNQTAAFYFKTFFPKKQVRHDKKRLSTHLFRHNIAKQMFLAGSSRAEIKEFLGEKSILNSNNYIDSELTHWSDSD